MPTDKAVVARVNNAIAKATVNQYKSYIPCVALFEILQANGFEPLEPDDSPMLVGRQGRAIFEFTHAQFPERDYLLHLSWYKMDSGNYEIVSRFEGVKSKHSQQSRPLPVRDRQLISEINRMVKNLTVNRYERIVPYETLFGLLENAGFVPTENSNEFTHGSEGRMTVEFIHPEFPGRVYYLHLTWYRMPSTNYETVARFEALNRH